MELDTFIEISKVQLTDDSWSLQLMITRLTFIVLFATLSLELLGCQCAHGLRRNFLSRVKKFDAIVVGTFNVSNNGPELSLSVNRVLKGTIEQDEIELLAGGTDCMHHMNFDDGAQVVLGLVNSPYSGYQNEYMSNGCVTSGLIVNEQVVQAPERQLPMFKKPRIGWFNSKMKLKRLERRVNRRVWWNNLI